MAYLGPMIWDDYLPCGKTPEDILREDAVEELKTLNKKANSLLCKLYKIPRHFFGPGVNLMESSEAVLNDKHRWQIFLHAEGFKPDEIKIEEIDGQLLVKGDHEEREDEHGFIERSFVRTYVLPKEINSAETVSRLTPEGILTIEATTHEKLPDRPAARTIPIQNAHVAGKT